MAELQAVVLLRGLMGARVLDDRKCWRVVASSSG